MTRDETPGALMRPSGAWVMRRVARALTVLPAAGLVLLVASGVSHGQTPARQTIQKVSGEGTSCEPGTNTCRFTVRVIDGAGRPVGGARIRWTVPGRAVTPRVTVTDATGHTSQANILTAGRPAMATPDWSRQMQQQATIDGTSRSVTFRFTQRLGTAQQRIAQQRADADGARWDQLARGTAEQSRVQSQAAADAQAQVDARAQAVDDGRVSAGAARIRPYEPGVVAPRRDPTPAELDRNGMDAFRARDLASALEWWRRAADAGHLPAALRLGDMYFHGREVARNHAEALRWYRRAAALESGVGARMVGEMYLAGQGVRAERNEGIRWLRIAAARGDAVAKRRLRAMGVPEVAPPVRQPPRPPRPPRPTPAPQPVRQRACATLNSAAQMQRPLLRITRRDISVWIGPYVEKAQLRHVASGAIRYFGSGPATVTPGDYVLSLHGYAVAGVAQRDPITTCVTYE